MRPNHSADSEAYHMLLYLTALPRPWDPVVHFYTFTARYITFHEWYDGLSVMNLERMKAATTVANVKVKA